MFRKLSIHKPITKGELHDIECRLNEIDILLDSNLPDDIHNNLCDEVDFIVDYLKKSERTTMIYEKMQQKGFKIVS